jgi:Zn-dependent protease with chaperone function
VSDVIPYRLKGLSPKAYEHPADRAATAALQSIPMLNTAVRKLIELQYERAFRQVFLASGVRIGPDQLPEVYESYRQVLAVLDMPDEYDLYLIEFPLVNAAAIGAERPLIVVNSALVSLLEPDELRTVLAHELGHILSNHMLYRTALLILLQMTLPRLPLIAGVPLLAVRAALLEWSRAAELSCDRAATLANRDPLVTARTLMTAAAGIRSSKLNLDAFLRQATEYHEWDSPFDRAKRFFIELSLEHDFAVRRVSELMKWIRSGEYDRIIGGEYRTREEPPDPGREAESAVAHYRERFRKILKEGGDEAERASTRVADWWRGRP